MPVSNEIMPIHTSFMSNIKLWNLWFVTNLADLSNKYCTLFSDITSKWGWCVGSCRNYIHILKIYLLSIFWMDGRGGTLVLIRLQRSRKITTDLPTCSNVAGGVVSLDWVNNDNNYTIYYATSFQTIHHVFLCSCIWHIWC